MDFQLVKRRSYEQGCKLTCLQSYTIFLRTNGQASQFVCVYVLVASDPLLEVHLRDMFVKKILARAQEAKNASFLCEKYGK